MKEKLFSKKTIETLEDAGYIFKQKENFVSFRHTATDRIGLALIGLLLLFASFFLLTFGVVIWAGAVLLLIFSLISVGKRMAGRSLLMFDTRDKTFFYKTKNGPPKWFPLKEIKEIILRSKFVSEYTSALKSTSEEHMITISFRLVSGKTLDVFRFLSDYAEPSISIKEIQNWLESTIKEAKPAA